MYERHCTTSPCSGKYPAAAPNLMHVRLSPAILTRTFFKYFKVNLEQECPFWEEDGQCFMRDCSVCECSPDEIPKPWLEQVCDFH